jgi:hypothetical protein
VWSFGTFDKQIGTIDFFVSSPPIGSSACRQKLVKKCAHHLKHVKCDVRINSSFQFNFNTDNHQNWRAMQSAGSTENVLVPAQGTGGQQNQPLVPGSFDFNVVKPDNVLAVSSILRQQPVLAGDTPVMSRFCV